MRWGEESCSTRCFTRHVKGGFLSILQVACLIRVPTEVVKQRTQASPSSTTYQMLLATLREEVNYNQKSFFVVPFNAVTG